MSELRVFLLFFRAVKISLIRLFYTINYYNKLLICYMGRDSLVGMTTCYGLNGPGIETRWGPPSHGVKHTLPSSAEVKERVQLYLYSLSGPSQPLLGRTLLLCCINYINYIICCRHDYVDSPHTESNCCC